MADPSKDDNEESVEMIRLATVTIPVAKVFTFRSFEEYDYDSHKTDALLVINESSESSKDPYSNIRVKFETKLEREWALLKLKEGMFKCGRFFQE